MEDAALCLYLKRLCYSSVIDISVFTADVVVFAFHNSLNMKQNAHENVMLCSRFQILDQGEIVAKALAQLKINLTPMDSTILSGAGFSLCMLKGTGP